MSNAGQDEVRWLQRRWSERFPEMAVVGDAVIERYGEPGRIYHDVRHLAEVLQHIDTLVDESGETTAVELAAWFHDSVYDVRRDDNEEASAELARSLLTPRLPADLVGEVARLVLLTRDHAVGPGDANGAVLCDADLAVLAGEPAAYADYVSRVRREYADVPDDAFRAGRAAVLKGLLNLPSLFHTTLGAAQWEPRARANLTSELALLTDHPQVSDQPSAGS